MNRESRTNPMRASGTKGFTLVELLVVIAIIGLLIGMLLPALGKAQDTAKVNQSKANLRNLVSANTSYWADFKDRQPTFVNDGWGSLPPGCQNGCSPQAACNNYQTNYGCNTQMILGFAASGGIWGYWVNGPLCGFSVSTTCAQNACVYVPICFSGADGGFGSFRIPNIKHFSTYLNGKYYDAVFVAPKDTLNLEIWEPFQNLPDEFTYSGTIGFSSYCWSPAAMWNQAVMGGIKPCEQGFQNPNQVPSAYRSPTASQAKYAANKMLMWEHGWFQNPPPSPVNGNFSGGQEGWYFNHGYNSSPVCAFFDGSIRQTGMWEFMDSDSRASGSQDQGCGLWLRDTPFGSAGYYGNQSYDFLVNGSPGILTRGGITGRDIVVIQ